MIRMNDINFLDIITILAFIIGLKNLALNEQQVDSLQEHLSQQDEQIKRITSKGEQNE